MTEQKPPGAVEDVEDVEDVEGVEDVEQVQGVGDAPAAEPDDKNGETGQEPDVTAGEEAEVVETRPVEPDSQPVADARTDRQAPDSQHEAPPPPKPKGRFLASLALLLALAAGAGAGYVYYLLVYLEPMANLQSQSSELLVEYGQLQASLTRQMQELRAANTAALDEVKAEQAERLEINEDAVLKSLNEALLAAPPSQREWKLAEAEYLLRIANHRVLMEQDSAGALSLLQAADRILEELDDFALYQVRARLADEIIALRQVPRQDLQGLYLGIEAIKSKIAALPLPTPEYLRTDPAPEPELTVWQMLWEELQKFIRIRRLDSDEAVRPLLAPQERTYLELNLRLALEQAQLATLKRQQDVYEQSLGNVKQWLADHADTDDERTQALLGSVDELLNVELARPLPDVSGSLSELLAARGSGG